jgi:DNA repair protein RAD5
MNKLSVPVPIAYCRSCLTPHLDRVHRIGQSRRVRVRRFVVQNTVEARIQELQDRKLKLAAGALQQCKDGDDESKARLENLMSLFRAF